MVVAIIGIKSRDFVRTHQWALTQCKNITVIHGGHIQDKSNMVRNATKHILKADVVLHDTRFTRMLDLPAGLRRIPVRGMSSIKAALTQLNAES